MLLDSKVNRYRPDKGIQTRLIDNMSQSKNKTEWVTGLLVPLLVVCLAVGWLLWIWNNTMNVTTETFQNESAAYTGFIQKANVISTDTGVSSPANQTIDEAVEYSYSRKIQLGDLYYVKQLCISNLFTFTDPTLPKVSDIRIGIKNNRNNTI